MPPTPSSRSCSVELSCELTAPRAARSLVSAVLHQWGVDDADVLDTASIVVSELVTNVLVHCREGGSFTLALDLRDGVVVLGVADSNPAVPTQRTAAEDEESGRGLSIVQQLVGRWDVETSSEGKRVVVELPLPATWCA